MILRAEGRKDEDGNHWSVENNLIENINIAIRIILDIKDENVPSPDKEQIKELKKKAKK